MKNIFRSILKFGREFNKADSSTTHSPYAAMLIAFCLATPIVCLSCSIIITHFFVHGKPLDAPMVDLLKYMLGAATGIVVTAGGAMAFSKTTTVSNFTATSPGLITKVKPDSPEGKGEV